MKPLIITAVVSTLLTLTACTSSEPLVAMGTGATTRTIPGDPPLFHAEADHEEGNDVPCFLHGIYQTGWHRCRVSKDACCPDGYSCSRDDFASTPADRPEYCRWWGREEYYGN